MPRKLDAGDALFVRLAKETVIETMGGWSDAEFDQFIAAVRRQYKERQRQRLKVVDGQASEAPVQR